MVGKRRGVNANAYTQGFSGLPIESILAECWMRVWLQSPWKRISVVEISDGEQ